MTALLRALYRVISQKGAIELLLQGPRLYLQQWYGLFLKRGLSAKRDRLALVTQLLVPIALVLVALWARQATDAFPQEPALDLSRWAARQPLPFTGILRTTRATC